MRARERQIQMLNYLVRVRKETVAGLAREFSVSLRTIKYDLASLSQIYPIYSTPGPGGGIELIEGFIINGYIMQKEQLELIAKGLRLLAKHEPGTEILTLLKMLEPRYKARDC